VIVRDFAGRALKGARLASKAESRKQKAEIQEHFNESFDWRS
jgi:hypothetical protein